MSRLFRAAVVAGSFVVAGCAIRPLPEDVTGVSTFHIVRQIRCETRQAIIRSAVGWLKTQPYDESARRIGAEFADGVRPIRTFHYGLFKHPRINSIVKLFSDTGVAYNYQLTMTETNDIGGGVNLLKPFTDAKLTVGFGADFNRQRQNLRTFTVTDKFSHLIRDVPDDYCDDHIVEANYIYPIAGKIGVEPVIQEFIRLTLFGRLGGPVEAPQGPPTLVDQLEFQTIVSANASPTIVFTPIGTALSVTDASLTGKASRRDVHKVTLGLAIDDGSVPLVEPLRGTLFGPLLTASGGRSQLLAAQAVNQALTLTIFPQTVRLTP